MSVRADAERRVTAPPGATTGATTDSTTGATTDDAPPAALTDALFAGEAVLWWARPVRPASGNARWAVAAIGALFVPAGFGALVDVAGRDGSLAAKLPLLAGGALLLTFALVALAFPWLVARRMRRTVAAVTTLRVVEAVVGRRGLARVRTWPVDDLGEATVGRRRGASASLILKERLRERATDGRTVYEWEAVHGLPDADAALSALRAARARRRT